MTLAKMLVLCAVVALLPLVAADDDDTCYNPATKRQTKPKDCPHDCCWGKNCGSKNECRRALIIGLTIGGVALLCCCIIGAVVFCYCTAACCFQSKESTVVYSQQAQQQQQPGAYQQPAPYQQPAYQQGAAVAPAGYPPADGAAAGYPPAKTV